jgi:CTP synthase (UTP-ammonia lyase)
LHITDAGTAEYGPESTNLVIWPVSCAVPNRSAGAPKLSGGGKLTIVPGTRFAGIYQKSEVQEEYFCNYEVNPIYQGRLQEAGLRVSAWGEDRAMRAVELQRESFYVATLFQPQLSSTEKTPHPVVMAYLQAAAEFAQTKHGASAGHQPNFDVPIKVARK